MDTYLGTSECSNKPGRKLVHLVDVTYSFAVDYHSVLQLHALPIQITVWVGLESCQRPDWWAKPPVQGWQRFFLRCSPREGLCRKCENVNLKRVRNASIEVQISTLVQTCRKDVFQKVKELCWELPICCHAEYIRIYSNESGSTTVSLYLVAQPSHSSLNFMLPCLARQEMIHDMLSKLQEQQAQDSRRDAWCKAEVASTRQSKAAAPNTTLPCRLCVIACHLDEFRCMLYKDMQRRGWNMSSSCPLALGKASKATRLDKLKTKMLATNAEYVAETVLLYWWRWWPLKRLQSCLYFGFLFKLRLASLKSDIATGKEEIGVMKARSADLRLIQALHGTITT